MTPSTHLIRIVFNINLVQYQTGLIRESDKHIFAKIPEICAVFDVGDEKPAKTCGLTVMPDNLYNVYLLYNLAIKYC